jgi:serine/arginine repetitive matrix protein 1
MADAGENINRQTAWVSVCFCLQNLQGFFKGRSADQDRRFSDKELKLLKTMKFPPEFDKKVLSLVVSKPPLFDQRRDSFNKIDMRKVNLTVIRPWVAKKVVELVGFEDELVVEYTMGLLEDQQQPVRLL